MNVFFYCIGNPTPIFETELELIRKHEKSGDTIRVLQCTGNLGNCFWNQAKNKFVCAMCRSKFKHGWGVLNAGKEVELKRFPLNKLMHSDLPLDFNSVDDLKRYRYDNENIGFGVASRLISEFRDHRFDTVMHRRQVFRELNTSIQVYETLKHEFKEFKPDRVYIFNGRITTQLPAVLLCKRMDIEYFSYEVAYTPNSYLLRKNSTSHSRHAMREEIDKLWAVGGPEREKTSRYFFQQRRAGVDHDKISSFTKYQVKNLLPNGFNKDKKNIAIFNSTIDEYAAIEGWENPLYEPDETAGICRILEAFESDARYMFYLRVHPHMKEVPNTTSQLRDIHELSSRFCNLHVIWPADIVDSYELMDACEKVITFGSTIGIEAAYWGKPSILAGYAVYENFDCIYVPKTHDELVTLLRENIGPRPAYSALKYGFREISHGTPFDYFRETGFRNGLAVGTFDGVEIKPDVLPDLLSKVDNFLLKIKRVVMEPSLILRKLKN
jgi:hypothetical protein